MTRQARVVLVSTILGIARAELPHRAWGQLAITEVMSSASTNNTLGTAQGPDFWELTHWGTEPLDLTGYRWNDNAGGLAGADPTPFLGLTIQPGESILFVQDNVPEVSTPESFRSWWGLPPTQKVVFYTGNGLSSEGDSVILWGPEAQTDEDAVARVDFGPALRGRTFLYDQVTGAFGVPASEDMPTVVRAVLSDDLGSPGTHEGPVPLAIVVQPTNQVGYVGFPVTFHVAARGLPSPRYQWLKDGVPLPGQTRPTLSLESVQPNDAGTYQVWVTNGLEGLLSTPALLTVDQGPSGPVFTLLLQHRELEAYPGQTLRFRVAAQGNPAPAYQWYHNHQPLTGQDGPELVLPSVGFGASGDYTVRVTNLVGSTQATVRVIVAPRPRLLITEVHSTGSSQFQDWWELTNFDTRPIQLQGYRFDDDSQSLTQATVITNDVVIEPGESIVLVESTAARPMTPEIFRQWWGPDHLPSSVKILVYAGPGLGLSSSGDAVYLWNAAATEDGDFVCGVTFGAAPANPRRTFVYNLDQPQPQAPVPGSLTLLAEVNQWGAFAATNGDVGSPGRVVEPLRLSTGLTPEGPYLEWFGPAGKTYVLEFSGTVSPPTWTVILETNAPTVRTRVALPHVSPPAFYRLGLRLPFPEP